MNKLIIALLVFGAGAVALYFIFGTKDTEEVASLPIEMQELAQQVDEATLEDAEQALEESGKQTTHGSCNAIAESSTCIDYVGSVWGEVDSALLNCSDSGTYSKNPCPQPSLGGCQTSGGSVTEMIAWMYREGDGGIDDESLPYAKMACEASPVATWVMSR